MKLKIKGNFKTLLNYIVLIVVSSILIATVLVALPLTERISQEISFNLTTTDSTYWSKEYILNLKTDNQNDVRNFENILSRRLRDFNVERVSIRKIETEEENNTNLRVVVNTSKNQRMVEQLIKTRYHYEIVTRKADVNFENEEDPYAMYMAENYETTEWNWEDFRNIHVTSLRTTAGTDAYFAIYKQWPQQRKAFQEFLKSKKGETIGVNIDGFVSPFDVTDSGENEITFALPIYTSDTDEARITSLLYNSGHIPVEFSLESEENLPTTNITIDYFKIAIGLTIALITTYIYLLIFKQSSKRELAESFFATVITLSTYIAILKVQHISVYTLLLALGAIIISIIIRVLTSNKESQKYILLSLFMIYLVAVNLGTGFIHIFAKEMAVLTLIAVASIMISKWYIGKIRKI